MSRPVVEVMEELNASRDVPTLLRVAGVRGRKGESCSCPIAEYVKRETGAVRVDVSPSYTTAYFISSVTRVDGGDGVKVHHEDNSDEVYMFVEDFDTGWYPELDIEVNP